MYLLYLSRIRNKDVGLEEKKKCREKRRLGEMIKMLVPEPSVAKNDDTGTGRAI